MCVQLFIPHIYCRVSCSRYGRCDWHRERLKWVRFLPLQSLGKGHHQSLWCGWRPDRRPRKSHEGKGLNPSLRKQEGPLEEASQVESRSCYSAAKSCSTLELQHARLPRPSLSPTAYSNSCPLSQRCHPTISSLSFPMNQLFTSGGQSIAALASALALSVSVQGWFLSGWTGLISLLSKALSRVFSSTIVQKHQFFSTQLSFFFFFKFSFLFYFFYNFKIFNSYMRSQTWTPLPPPSP